MTTRLVHRPARVVRPPGDEAPVQVEAPPVMPEGRSGGNLQSLVPVVGAGASMTMMLVFRSNPAFAAIGALVMIGALVSAFAMMFTHRGQAARQRKQQRERYLDYLDELREDLSTQERAARSRALVLDPPPAALLDAARDPARLWERRRRDTDFLTLRIGTGTLPARGLDLRDKGSALQPTDEFMRVEADSVVRRFSRAPGMPLRVTLDLAGDISIIGDRDSGLAVARALVTQLATLHAPDDVGIALVHPGYRQRDWDWARWLPHLADQAQHDDAGQVRRIATSGEDLSILIDADLKERAGRAAEARRNFGARSIAPTMSRLVVLVDEHGETARPLPLPDRAAAPAELGLTVVHLVSERLHEPGEVSVRISVGGSKVRVEDLRRQVPVVVEGDLDDVPAGLADGLGRILAPVRLSAESTEDGGDASPEAYTALLGIEDPAALDIRQLWKRRSHHDFLRVPLGLDDNGRPAYLDLKESAQYGMGPHGLCVGATGSGKSELLRALVLSLVATHPPDLLSMILVDYKGGATFAPFAGLPHVAGVITNLSDDVTLVERVHTSLAGEVQRRQQVLKDAGNLANITDYQVVRAQRAAAGEELPPLPHLMVIIDEFGELLTAKPDFIELFLSIGRIGRSIGVHLLLSSQRIEGGKLRGLDTYLSYRLGLRTFSEMESRTVLDTPDAFHLPPLPGFGFLKVDTTVYQRFKSAYVSGLYEDPSEQEGEEVEAPQVMEIPRFGRIGDRPVEAGQVDPDDWMAALVPANQPGLATVAAGLESDLDAAIAERATGPTLMSTVVSQLVDAAPPVPQIWLPPLPERIALDRVGGRLDHTVNGLRIRGESGRLQVPIGLLDDPAKQWQGTWRLDLGRSGGHVAIVGGPQSGKSTTLRTIVLGIALSHTPTEIGVYGVDLLGGGLAQFADLPHVGGVAGRGDRERVRRTLQEILGMIEHREQVFKDRGIDSLATLRAAHAAGRIPELTSADVVLALDGYGQINNDFEEVDSQVHAILARGGAYGVHLVATMSRWNEVRMAQQSAFGTKLELRLADPSESTIGRKFAETVREETPGRAITDRKLLGHVALPRIDSIPDPTSLGEGGRRAVAAVKASHSGARAQAIRVLPAVVPASALPSAAECPSAVPIGLDEHDLGPALVDLFGADQHLFVVGDAGSGKTNLTRLVARELMKRYTDEELVFAIFDPRRGLQGAVPEAYLGGYAPSAALAAQLTGAVSGELAKRMPSDPAALAAGTTTYSGPRIVLLIDDYDILTAGGTRPLDGFAQYLASARDIGMHVVLTRRVAGATRGFYEPFTLALRESGVTALIMSGDRTEGQLFNGVRASVQPPGRGILVRQGIPQRTVQTAFVDRQAERDR